MGADREYSSIIKGLESAESAMESLGSCARMLRTEAEAASGELKDKIGKQDIEDLTNLADAIESAVKPGTERIRELIQQAKKEKEMFEGLER